MVAFLTRLMSRRTGRLFRCSWTRRQVGIAKIARGWFGHHGGNHSQDHQRNLWAEIFNFQFVEKVEAK